MKRLAAALCLLALAMIACTSNDTLFIHLTETPIPTLTPTASALSSRFRPNETVIFVAQTSPATLFASPSTTDKSNALCFTNTAITILEAAKTGDATFYKIKCASVTGWVSERNLTPFRAGGTATLAADAYLTNDPEPDSTDNRAAKNPCKTGASASILDLAMSKVDSAIYLNVQCGSDVGWLPESAAQVKVP